MRRVRQWLASAGWFTIPDPGLKREWRDPIIARLEAIDLTPRADATPSREKRMFVFIAALVLAYGLAATMISSGAGMTRLVVIFGSHASGIDPGAEQRLRALIAEFETKNRTRLAHKKFAWGLEGERTYCFALNELDLYAERAFIARVRMLAERPHNGWTTVKEYGRCEGHGPTRPLQ
jgi:hypothetical protein